MSISPVMSDEELRRRYDDLSPIEELAGERTFLSRCATWEMFVERAPMLAERWAADRNSDDVPAQKRALDQGWQHPELYDLIVEAFPQ